MRQMGRLAGVLPIARICEASGELLISAITAPLQVKSCFHLLLGNVPFAFAVGGV
jgi:hypothetical protein